MKRVSTSIQQLRAALKIEKDGMSQSDAAESIESISDILREIKTHFNTCSPISRLPEAVLTMVFTFAAFNDAVDTLKAYKRRADVDFETLVALTHVCTEWRCVALDYPALWTRLDAPRSRNRHIFNSLVKRTKSMPLDINLAIGDERINLNLRGYRQEYMSRTRHLQISIMNVRGIHSVAEVVNCISFTSLECLKISHAPSVTNHEEFYYPTYLDEEFVAGRDVSHLQALALDAMEILPFILVNYFPDLTHVYIRMKEIDMDELFFFLSQAQNIESFGLQDVCSVSDLENFESPIIMSNMKIVHFDSSDLQSSFTILSHLSLPSFSLIRFDKATGFKDLPTDAAGPLAPLFDEAKLSVHDATHMELGSDIHENGCFIAGGPSARIRLTGKSSSFRSQLFSCLGLRNTVSFSTITSLILKSDFEGPNDPVTFFQACPHLADLSLYGFTLLPLIHILASSPAACPDLRTLSVACSIGIEGSFIDWLNTVVADLATDLVFLAKARKLAGIPLRSLTVQPHHMQSYSTELTDTTAAIYEMRRKFHAPLADIVEEFKYMEPGVETIQLGTRMAEMFLPDDKYWDIMRHIDHR